MFGRVSTDVCCSTLTVVVSAGSGSFVPVVV